MIEENQASPKAIALSFASLNGFTITGHMVDRHMRYEATRGEHVVEAQSYGSLFTRMKKLMADQGETQQHRAGEKGREVKAFNAHPVPTLNWTSRTREELREAAGPEACAIVDSLDAKTTTAIADRQKEKAGKLALQYDSLPPANANRRWVHHGDSRGRTHDSGLRPENLPKAGDFVEGTLTLTDTGKWAVTKVEVSPSPTPFSQRNTDEAEYFEKLLEIQDETARIARKRRPWVVEINGKPVVHKGSRAEALKVVRRMFSGAALFRQEHATVTIEYRG